MRREQIFNPPNNKLKVYDFIQQQLHHLMSAPNTCTNKHLTLRQKCEKFSRDTNTNTMKYWDLLKFYKIFQISRQKLSFRLGPPNMPTHDQKLIRIRGLQSSMRWATQQKRLVVLMDECVFSPNTYRGVYYAPQRNPHKLTKRYSNQKYVAVMGFIGGGGAILFKYKTGAAFIG